MQKLLVQFQTNRCTNCT